MVWRPDDEYVRWQTDQNRATEQARQSRAGRAGQWARDRATNLGQRAKDAATTRGQKALAAGRGAKASRIVRWGAPAYEGLDYGLDMAMGAPEGATRGGYARTGESAGRLAATLAAAKLGAKGGALAGTAVLPGWGSGIGALAGGLGGAYLGYTGANRAMGAAMGGELPSEEWARLRGEQGLAPGIPLLDRAIDDTVRPAAQDIRRALNTPPSAPEPRATEPTAPAPGPIFRGERDGQPYFSNVPFEGGVAEPDFEQRMGTMTVVPSSFFTNPGPTPQANVEAIRAAAARGDWDALERIGAISPRGPRAGGGGGGFAMPQGPDMLARSDELMKRANDLYNRADRARSLTERSRYLKQARAMMGMAEGSQGQAASIYGTQGSLAQAMAAAQAGGDPTKAILNIAQAQKAMAEAQATEFGMGRPTAQDITALGQFAGEPGQQFAENVASERLLESYAPAVQQMAQVAGGFEGLLEMLSGGAFANDPSMENAIRMMAMRSGATMPQQPRMRDRVLSAFRPEGYAEGYAEGGYVDPMMSAMGGYGMEDTLGPMGAMGMAGGVGMPDPLQVEYNQYVQGAEKLGIPAIPFEQFVQMKQMSIPEAPQAPDMTQPMGAMGFNMGGYVDSPFMSRQSALGYARGGAVDAGGKMVVDPDPNAPTDSIPAVIDGERPAALDSGEFVIPRHAVMFHGIDKLNKLIAQAEKEPTDAPVPAHA